MMRLPDWNSRLFALLKMKENAQFKYGTNDCCLFGSDVIEAITGIDPATEYRGRYRSLSGGLKLIKKAGYKSHIDYLEQNFEPIHVSMSRDGDLGIISTNEGPAIVVLTGVTAAGIGTNGISRFPIGEVERSFKIGA